MHCKVVHGRDFGFFLDANSGCCQQDQDEAFFPVAGSGLDFVFTEKSYWLFA